MVYVIVFIPNDILTLMETIHQSLNLNSFGIFI